MLLEILPINVKGFPYPYAMLIQLWCIKKQGLVCKGDLNDIFKTSLGILSLRISKEMWTACSLWYASFEVANEVVASFLMSKYFPIFETACKRDTVKTFNGAVLWYQDYFFPWLWGYLYAITVHLKLSNSH